MRLLTDFCGNILKAYRILEELKQRRPNKRSHNPIDSSDEESWILLLFLLFTWYFNKMFFLQFCVSEHWNIAYQQQFSRILLIFAITY